MQHKELLPMLAFVLLVLLLVAVALVWVSPVRAVTPDDTQPAWPQVTRVIMPEDLDRCG